VTLGVLLLLTLGYIGAASALADQVPFNSTIGGVSVGGMGSEAAVAKLEEEFAGRATAPIEVSAGEAFDTLEPAAAGLAVDAAGSVADVTGFSLAPSRMWQHIVGAGRVSVDSAVDDAALTAALTDLASRVDTAPVDGAVTFVAAVPQAVTPVPGQRVDVAAAASLLSESWLTAAQPIAIPTTEVPPAADQAAVDEALTQAASVVSGPVTVRAGGRDVSVAPALFADSLSYAPDGSGGLELQADGAVLRDVVLSLDPAVETAPVNASVSLENGAPVIVPAVNGVVLDPAVLAAAVTTALADDRVALVEATGEEPEITTAEVEALGIKEVVSTFSTPFPNNAARTENLRLATATITGTIVMPGEEFSLNEALGERTAAKGYGEAGAISNGRYVSDIGGGVSQVSTTLYNATFFAGLEDVTHKPHSFYISRYPEGREATLNWDPRVENKFRNNTDFGILIQAYVADGQITVTYWSTKVWDVESVTSQRSNFRSPETIYDTTSGCEAHESSIGFDVSVTRIWKQGGVEVDRETKTTTYLAAPTVICGPKP